MCAPSTSRVTLRGGITASKEKTGWHAVQVRASIFTCISPPVQCMWSVEDSQNSQLLFSDFMTPITTLQAPHTPPYRRSFTSHVKSLARDSNPLLFFHWPRYASTIINNTTYQVHTYICTYVMQTAFLHTSWCIYSIHLCCYSCFDTPHTYMRTWGRHLDMPLILHLPSFLQCWCMSIVFAIRQCVINSMSFNVGHS